MALNKRSEVRAMIKAAVDSLSPAIGFNSGLLTFFNSDRKNNYPYVFMEAASVTPDFTNPNLSPVNSWDIILHCADLDRIDSIPDQYELIVDDMDETAAKLITKINQVVSGYKNVTISGISREPFVKKHADCLSGVILTFTIMTDDKSNNC